MATSFPHSRDVPSHDADVASDSSTSTNLQCEEHESEGSRRRDHGSPLKAPRGGVIPFPISPGLDAALAAETQASAAETIADQKTPGVLFFSAPLATLLDEPTGTLPSLRESCEADGILCYPFSESKLRNALRS